MKRTLTLSQDYRCAADPAMRAPAPIDVAPEGCPVTPTFAKARARQLRQDLAAAGFNIPHSLALELVAHQQGFRATLTVADFRAVMAEHPGSTPVLVSMPDGPGETTSSVFRASRVTVKPSMASGQLPAVVMHGSYATGRYVIPRRLRLQLSGLSVGDPAVGQKVIEAVRAAVASLGFRGEANMGNDIETGIITWTYRADESVPLGAVDEAVRRAIARLNPGAWSLTSHWA